MLLFLLLTARRRTQHRRLIEPSLGHRKRVLITRVLRRIRRNLGLSQAEAARLTGGGHNAFSRYERGEVAPMPAVVNLFRILERHPELLREIGGRVK